jgi:hypothetical protein
LGLALFLSPAEVDAIQGGDMLDDPDQAGGFRELCGLGRDKPFECVGETGESRAALRTLGQQTAWREHAVVRALQPELSRVEAPSMESLLQPSSRHFVPAGLGAGLGLPNACHAED